MYLGMFSLTTALRMLLGSTVWPRSSKHFVSSAISFNSSLVGSYCQIAFLNASSFFLGLSLGLSSLVSCAMSDCAALRLAAISANFCSKVFFLISFDGYGTSISFNRDAKVSGLLKQLSEIIYSGLLSRALSSASNFSLPVFGKEICSR